MARISQSLVIAIFEGGSIKMTSNNGWSFERGETPTADPEETEGGRMQPDLLVQRG